MPTPFVSKRAPAYADVPDEKWNDWRWQLSHRLNSVEEIEKVITLTESERKALQTQGIFRVDVTPYFISLIDPNDPDDPTRKQIIPLAEELQSFTAMMEDSLAEDRHSPVPGLVHRYPDRVLMLVTTHSTVAAQGSDGTLTGRRGHHRMVRVRTRQGRAG